MVKITGPLLATEASGTLANTLTYAHTARGTVAKARIDRADARSAAQIGRRVMIGWLTQQWHRLTTAQQTTWADLPQAQTTSPYHAYLQHNAANWQNFLAPSRYYPATRNDNPPIRLLATAAWVEHRIKLTSSSFWAGDGWGNIIFASQTSGFSTAVGNAIIIAESEDVLIHTHWWTPPTIDTWYFNNRTFSVKGKMSNEWGELSAVP